MTEKQVPSILKRMAPESVTDDLVLATVYHNDGKVKSFELVDGLLHLEDLAGGEDWIEPAAITAISA